MSGFVFKSHLRISVIPGEGVLALSEDGSKALHGRVYELLAPLMDGSRDEDSLVDALAGEVDGAEVYYALALLEKGGLISESLPDVPPQTAAFWHGMVEPAAASAALGSKRVRVSAVGEADAAPLCIALSELGVLLTEEEAADFEVVATDDYLRSELEALGDASAAPTEMHRETTWRRRCSRDFSSWSSGMPWRYGGTTGCARDRKSASSLAWDAISMPASLCCVPFPK